MDNLVKRIVDMDKSLRNYVIEEKQRLQDLKNSVTEEGQRVREGYKEKADRRIDIIRKQNDFFIKEKYRQTEERYIHSKEQLDLVYEDNRSKWVDEIVKRCLEI